MDALDRRLLEEIQADVPLVARPYAALGARLDLAEDTVIHRLDVLTSAGILRQICAIFDGGALGYHSALVGAVVAPERLEAAAAVINGHPGVSHNYERDFDWNLWFTLAVPPDSRLGLTGTAARLAARAGLARYRLLPARRVFKIGVRLEMDDAPAAPRLEDAPAAPRVGGGSASLDDVDRTVVQFLQEPFRLVPEPFADAARDAGLAVDLLLERARAMLARGVIRRVAGLLHHRRAGFTANVMGVWVVPEDRVEAVGRLIARFNAVSHCYERPTYPDWPYSLFSMIHGRSRETCVAVLDAIAAGTGVSDHAALWTRRELKKTRLRYFTPDYLVWERAA